MSEAPDKIWAAPEKFGGNPFWDAGTFCAFEDGGTPYIREDLVPQWQDISTAPKNEAVLVRGGTVLYPTTMSNNDGGDGWSWFIDSQGGLHGNGDELPTHWMPLPEAPE